MKKRDIIWLVLIFLFLNLLISTLTSFYFVSNFLNDKNNNIENSFFINSSNHTKIQNEIQQILLSNKLEIETNKKITYQDLISTLIFQLTLYGVILTIILVLGGFFFYNNFRELKNETTSRAKEIYGENKEVIENSKKEFTKLIEKIETEKYTENERYDELKNYFKENLEIFDNKIENLEKSTKLYLEEELNKFKRDEK